jgi:phosphoserine phosphatase RsbU/P
MKNGFLPRVLLCADRPDGVADLRRLLEQDGCEVGCLALNGDDHDDLAAFQMVVLDGSACEHDGAGLCRRLRKRMGDGFTPILYVTADPAPAARLAGIEGGADAYLLRPFAAGELIAQVRAFLRIKDTHDRLAEKTAEVNRANRRLQQAYQQIDQELDFARRIQLSFLPQTLPEAPRVHFAVHYALQGQVGGDFYDAFRLDEHHVGFYVADAMGHGIPASLLTIFVKKGVRPKEVFGQDYRLVPPSEILERLNRDLVQQALSENPFITMAYCLLNHKEGTLSFARAGHPYPLHLPRYGEPAFLQVEGSLLGVFDTEFPTATHRLRPGDKLLLYSDGIDAATFQNRAPGAESLLACAERLRELPIQEFVERVAHNLFSQAGRVDDLTLLGLEMTA